MKDVYIIGVFATPVGKYLDRSFGDLVRWAYEGALSDAGMESGDEIEACYFSSYMADFHGQNMCRGNNFCLPLMVDGRMARNMPIFNVEVGCASGSVAVHSAWTEILSGQAEVAIAIGVEKMYHPSKSTQDALIHLGKAEPVEGYDAWVSSLKRAAGEMGEEFAFGAGRSIAMDFYALMAKEHMRAYGTTQRHIAFAASKNHGNSVHNPRAQYRFDMTVDDVLNDRAVAFPLTRSMCAPVGDAAAAAVLCSGRHLEKLAPGVRERALKIRAAAMAGGVAQRRHIGDRCTRVAAQKAYSMAGLRPSEIDVVELHDATSFAEIHLVEDLQLCAEGQGGFFTESGETRIGGTIPVNPSGGLVARGHPIGATGITMINELAIQLRGEAGANQVKDARIGLQENGGGLLSLDVALCSVMILERNG